MSCSNEWITIVSVIKQLKLNPKNKHAKSVSHNKFEKCMRIKHTIEIPISFT